MTPEVEEEIKIMSTMSLGQMQLANFVGLIVTAPLQTIVSSLQLSVKPHKRIFEEPLSKSTEVARLNTSLTIQEKRRMELTIRSGQEHKPYTAAVYDGYLGAIKGLLNQGPSAFFKGLFFRSIHNFAHFAAFTEISLFSNKRGMEEMMEVTKRIFLIYGLQSLIDMSINTMHIMENRYILQNNTP